MSDEGNGQAGSSGGGRFLRALVVFGAVAGAGGLVALIGSREKGGESPRPEVRSSAPRQVSAPGREPRQPTGEIQPGRKAPSLALPDLSGVMTSLHDLRGETVVLNIWASWCPPCLSEMPSLQKLHRESGEGLAVVSVSVDESLADAREVASRFGLTFPVLLDPGGDRAARWGTVMFPETWVIDADGVVLERLVGEQDWTDPALVSRLRSL